MLDEQAHIAAEAPIMPNQRVAGKRDGIDHPLPEEGEFHVQRP
jgi:hypothetical protein